MAKDFDKWTKQGQAIVSGGVSTAMDPELLNEDQLAWMRNGAVRDGKLTPRDALKERMVLPAGMMQGLDYFSWRNGLLVAMIAGKFYRIMVDGETFSAEEVDSGLLNSDKIQQAYFTETDGYMVVQDGQTAAIIYDGVDARRASIRRDPAIYDNDVPLGDVMAYGNGRIVCHNGHGRIFIGDVAGQFRGSELKFTETTYLSGGGWLAMPGLVTGAAFLPANDSQTGYGPTLIFGRNWTIALRTDIVQRELWQITQGFQTIVFPNIGCISQKSIVSFNQDLYWRDGRGELRSFRQAISDTSGPGNSGMSHEVSRLYDKDSQNLLGTCPAIAFNNRILMGNSPFINQYGNISYKDISSLDMTPTTSMNGKGKPVFDGEWEGVDLTHMTTGVIHGKERAFIASLDSDGNNRLWEIMPELRDDRYNDGTVEVKSPIKWTVDYRKFNFGSGLHYKRLSRFDMWVSNVKGDVSIKVYSRKDYDIPWQLWDEVSLCAEQTDEGGVDPHVWKNLKAGSYPFIRSLTAPDYIQSMVGQEFQVKLEIVGECKIDRTVSHAEIVNLNQPDVANRDPNLEVCQENDLTEGDFSYKIPIGSISGDTFTDEAGDTYVDEGGNTYIGV